MGGLKGLLASVLGGLLQSFACIAKLCAFCVCSRHVSPHVVAAGFGGDMPFNYFCYGAALAEVELDTLTGDFHLLRTDLCMDVGQSLNPAIDIGQACSLLHPLA